jgi:hypothetical protein
MTKKIKIETKDLSKEKIVYVKKYKKQDGTIVKSHKRTK